MGKLLGPVATASGVSILAASVGLTWWLFLGSDSTYQHASGGAPSGPYEAPQIVWCAVLLAVLTFAGALLLRVWAVIVTVPVSFTVAWSIDASRSDRTGLWAVGAIGVLLGTTALTGLVVYLADKIRTQLAKR